jgi:hypothetical protein
MARGGLAQPDPPGLRAEQIRHAAERLARGALLGRRAVERFGDFLEDSQRSRLGKTTAILQCQRLFLDLALFTFLFFAAGFVFLTGLVFLTGFLAARRAGFALGGLLFVVDGFGE